MTAPKSSNGHSPVLICDEAETYLSLETALLEQNGYQALSVRREELPDALERHKPRLLVLALKPNGDGIEIAERLRADPRTQTISVLATGIRGQIPKEEVRRRGANRLLWKPFSPDKFVRYVRELCSIAPRHPVNFDVVLKGKRPGGGPVKGKSVNLSESGILVFCEKPLAIGHRMILEGAVGRGGLTLEVEVVREAKELGPGHYALRFKLQAPMGRPAPQNL